MTRRNFLRAAAVAGAAVTLAGCDNATEGAGQTSEVPAADAYPIDAEEWGSGTPKHSEEETRDGWTRVTNEGGVTLGVADTGKLIQVGGFAFKDLNGNGKLDLWEDWRQSAEDRAAALAEQLTADEALALMLHGSVFNAGEITDVLPGVGPVEGDNTDPTMQEVLDHGIRTMLNFGNANGAPVLARWTNALQEYAEGQTYGIPVNISNNPKDYGFPSTLGLAASFDPAFVQRVANEEARAYRAEGVSTLLGVQMDVTSEPRWSRIPDTFGEDPALTRDMSRAFAGGLQSTFADGEDQGWGSESVINMLKHFPGDGCGEQGREAHNNYGKFCVYPGSNFAAHLIPFVDGGLHLDTKTEQTAAYMDSYSIAYSDDEEYGELVGSAFSKWKNDLLREKCGYDGLICSDWGVTDDPGAMVSTPWGMEDAPKVDRFKKIVEAGVDQIGGGFDLVTLKAAYDKIASETSEDEALARARTSARRALRTFYVIGLADCPYVDSSQADKIVESDELTSLATEAVDKSIVMLKNAGGAIKDRSGSKPKVYVPMKFEASAWTLPVTEETASEVIDIVTDTLGEPTGPADEDGNPTYLESDLTRATADEVAGCDLVAAFIKNPTAGMGFDDEAQTYVPITLQYGEYVADGPNVRETSIAGDVVDGVKENRSYVGKSTTAANASEATFVQEMADLSGDVPLVLCVNADRPMVFSEVEPLADAILMGFNAPGDDYLNVLAGAVEPTALLPLQMPANMDTVEANQEDVPRDLECYVDSEGNEYDFAYGLNWSGVIDDERVQTYSAEPLTTPENIEL
nr:glycoside hydrolase family 3 N-terminal domain-containing protein [Olsenella profusa]